MQTEEGFHRILYVRDGWVFAFHGQEYKWYFLGRWDSAEYCGGSAVALLR